MEALIFDCDGVLADTERDGHRVAFNRAFEEEGLDTIWDVGLYGKLLKIGGGKERMRGYFDQYGWPVAEPQRDALIKQLHALKTEIFMRIISSGELPVRPGINRIIDEVAAAGVKLAVCSTSNERAVNEVVHVLLGPERQKKFAGIFAGDIVQKKKPDPGIYLFAVKKLGLDPARCLVVEDSRNGLLAAKGAGMRCIVTKSAYTQDEDFSEADAVFAGLGEPPGPHVTFTDLRRFAATSPLTSPL
ncbi:MAG TPA: HAD family hydrolase [Candidatus Methylacidiphilales bacterium]|jgi:HAD superfamily hydrolase (TIGR01509 family)|nr:HAD family hydrolase [Candidatus Methylacidiphilales bacterium]